MTDLALEVSDLAVHVERGRRAVLDGVSLGLEPLGRLAVIGRSGAGKTTLLRAIAGLTAPTRGVVRLGGRPATDGPRLAIAPGDREVGLVFQGLALWPTMTVEETLVFATTPRQGTRRERRDRARALAARVGLGDRLTATPDALSGGEQQRLALARAIASAPRVLLLDEPFAHLDRLLRADLVEMLLDLQRDSGAALLFVSHDRQDVFDLARHALVLEAGRAVESGPVADLVARPRRCATAALLGLGALVPGTRQGDRLDTALGPLTCEGAGDVALVRPHQVRVAPAPDGNGVVRRLVVVDGASGLLRVLVRVGSLELHAAVAAPLAEGTVVRVSVEGGCAGLE
jgi:ABC-type sulfate/molybdate transport systems ATPase subunit